MVLSRIRAAGIISLRAVAVELNRRGMRTRRGGQWWVSNVKNLPDRIQAIDGSSSVRQ
jgi:hypothetical protein